MYTQAQLDALNAAIATGSKEVYYGDKRVVYRDLAEMIQIRNDMIAQLNPTSAKSQRKTPLYENGL